MDNLDSYVATGSAIVTALIVLGHALEAVVQKTANKTDDKALGAVMSVLNVIGMLLPRIKFGKPV